MKKSRLPILCLSALLASAGAAFAITAEEIEAAEFSGQGFGEGPDPLVAKVQILLDRNDASPGVIDGYPGENVDKAIRAFETMNGLEADGRLDEEVWAALTGAGGPVTMSYTITEEDFSRLVEEIPEDYSEQAEMEWLGYTSVEEKLAERFHMDFEFLKALNPEADFSRAGTEIVVADPGEDADAEVARIEVGKEQAQLLAFDEDGDMVAAYPVTVGSDQLPSPSGTHEVVAIAPEATYSYLPDENFQQGDNDEPLIIPAGPNNPVGGIWIELSEPSYGLHGTPAPDEIDKTQSHGCVRMTNWDARELAEMVEQGTVVEFVSD
jgi:lipoprotein-anchoring transpeptidase ErfK/SrfK